MIRYYFISIVNLLTLIVLGLCVRKSPLFLLYKYANCFILLVVYCSRILSPICYLPLPVLLSLLLINYFKLLGELPLLFYNIMLCAQIALRLLLYYYLSAFS